MFEVLEMFRLSLYNVNSVQGHVKGVEKAICGRCVTWRGMLEILG